jgi:hypothetical protein
MQIRILFRIQLINFDADLDPHFYLMWMRIPMRYQVTKMMRIRIHNTAFPGIQLVLIFSSCLSRLPPPTQFGHGNPFLMFLCLACLLQVSTERTCMIVLLRLNNFCHVFTQCC